MNLSSAFHRYLNSDHDDALSKLHEVITSQPGYERRTPWYSRASELITQDRHDETIRLILDHMPAAFFCPDAHSMLSRSYGQTHQPEKSLQEAFYDQTALQAIFESGSGTQRSPWKVLHVADEYTVLRDLAVTSESQAVTERRGEFFDVHTCSDSVERWFHLV